MAIDRSFADVALAHEPDCWCGEVWCRMQLAHIWRDRTDDQMNVEVAFATMAARSAIGMDIGDVETVFGLTRQIVVTKPGVLFAEWWAWFRATYAVLSADDRAELGFIALARATAHTNRVVQACAASCFGELELMWNKHIGLPPPPDIPLDPPVRATSSTHPSATFVAAPAGAPVRPAPVQTTVGTVQMSGQMPPDAAYIRPVGPNVQNPNFWPPPARPNAPGYISPGMAALVVPPPQQ